MFEAYAVGVTLKLHNLISPELTLVAGQFERLEGLAVSLKAALHRISLDAGALKSIARGAEASNLALERASRSASNFERHLAAVQAQAATMHGVPGLGAGVTPIPAPRVPGLPGGAPGGGGGGVGRGGHRQAGGFHGGNVHMGPNGVGIGSIGLAAGDAFVPLAVTAGMIYGGKALYESAKDLNTEMNRFKLFGMSEKLNEEAFKFVEGMQVYGTSRAENMRNFREAQGVFRESGHTDSSALEGAKLAAPVLAKLDLLAETFDEETSSKLKTANMAMLRYVELSGGLKSASDFNRIADWGWKLNQSSGGTVDWEQLRALKSTAGVAGYKLTDDALARLEPIIGELKGGGTGTALATAFGRISGVVKVPNQVAHQLVDYGLWEKDKVEFNSHGGIKRMKGNPLSAANTKLFQENPELFYEQVIRPMYAKMNLSSEQIARENLALFGRTGGKLFSAIEQALPTIHRSVEAMQKMKGIVDSIGQAKQSLSGQEREFTAAWTDFKAEFGTTMLPFFSGLLKGGASLLRDMKQFVGGQAEAAKGEGTLANIWRGVTMPYRVNFAAWSSILGGEKKPADEAQPGTPGKPAVVPGPAAAPALNPRLAPRLGAPILGVAPGQRSAPPSVLELSASTKPSFGNTMPTLRPTLQVASTPQQQRPSPFVAPPIKQTVQVSTAINLDGRKVAEAVTQHQAREASRPLAGSTGFDGSMLLSPVGMR